MKNVREKPKIFQKIRSFKMTLESIIELELKLISTFARLILLSRKKSKLAAGFFSIIIPFFIQIYSKFILISLITLYPWPQGSYYLIRGYL